MQRAGLQTTCYESHRCFGSATPCSWGQKSARLSQKFGEQAKMPIANRLVTHRVFKFAPYKEDAE
jgi:hypothetical protein